ncbi:hypothetical protein KIPB_005074, partial [Kipferlia bialata]|eukprot:g5074.t1
MISEPDVNLISIVWMCVAVVVLLLLLSGISAPYGRYTPSSWSLNLPNRTGWVLMELPSLLIMAVAAGGWVRGVYPLMLAGVWILHYTYRALVFPFRLRTSGKRMPLILALGSILFNAVNATLNGYYLAFYQPDTTLVSIRVLLGLGVVATGTYTHIVSDSYLMSLRQPGDTGYSIPTHPMFKYVSCPNYAGEMLVWVGYSILALSLPALSFLVWTMANLVPRARQHHRWYRE